MDMRLFSKNKITPATQRAQIESAMKARVEKMRVEWRQAAISGHPNGLVCPACGSGLGDLPATGGGGVDGCAPPGTLTLSNQWCGCSQCNWEGWRVVGINEWTGNGFKELPLSEFT